MLELHLEPADIQVRIDEPVSRQPPKMDILILRNHLQSWSPEQRSRLPDGIRDTRAGHIVIEFKHTESLNDHSVHQALSYDYFYRSSRRLSAEKVQTFLVSSRSPRSETLKSLGYMPGTFPGVYHSQAKVLERVTLISLNELSNASHNAAFKLFASKRKIKRKAFETMEYQTPWWEGPLGYLMNSLYNIWFVREGEEMLQFTPEEIVKAGEFLGRGILARASVDERLEGIPSGEVLRRFADKEVMENYAPKQRIEGLAPNEVLELYSAEQRIQGLKMEERLSGLTPEEILAYVKGIVGEAS